MALYDITEGTYSTVNGIDLKY